MTLVFGKHVNEFNNRHLVQPDQLKAVVDKYAYRALCYSAECLSDLS